MAPIHHATSSRTVVRTAPGQTLPQGSITLYTNESCSSAMCDMPTYLMAGRCHNIPSSGVSAVSISSLPTCGENGIAVLRLWDQPNCESSTATAETADIGKCQAYSTGADIQSTKFVCDHASISVVLQPRNDSSTTMLYQNGTEPLGNEQKDKISDSNSDYCCRCGSCCECCNCSCCCECVFCVVM